MNMQDNMQSPIDVRRLGPADTDLAPRTLRLMADVFDEGASVLSAAYVRSLLDRGDFWLLAALRDGAPVGGITAHVLPMTRNASTELFVYDLAVHADHQRQGIGRALITTLRTEAAAAGISVAFVLADNEDAHAVEFYRALGGDAAAVTAFTFE
jgi:aminoglycoside 3-N-acetyltransferase I